MMVHIPSGKVVRSMMLWGGGALLLLMVIVGGAQALIMGDWRAPLDIFLQYPWLIGTLFVLFAVQVALIRLLHIRTHALPIGAAASSGSVSAGTMIACCMHNAVYLLPFLGTTGLAAALMKYQREMLIASVTISTLGLLWLIRKHKRLHACCK